MRRKGRWDGPVLAKLDYPKRSKAAYPPPRWVFGYLLIDCGQKVLIFSCQGTEKIDFGVPRGQKILIFGAPGKEILIFGIREEKMLTFGAPGREILILVSGKRKYWFLVLRSQKILIFGAPEAPTKGGDPSTCQNPPGSFEKTMVLGGGHGRGRYRRKSWTP